LVVNQSIINICLEIFRCSQVAVFIFMPVTSKDAVGDEELDQVDALEDDPELEAYLQVRELINRAKSRTIHTYNYTYFHLIISLVVDEGVG
jgi:hypothetical protein